jgi:hypothetical protein
MLPEKLFAVERVRVALRERLVKAPGIQTMGRWTPIVRHRRFFLVGPLLMVLWPS